MSTSATTTTATSKIARSRVRKSPPPDEVNRMQIIYPVYIDKNKSLSQGRKIAKEKCVENPKATEIADICQHLKIPYELEKTKRYPQEPFEFGRVRVLLKKDSVPQHEWTTKADLLEHIASLVPRLETRVNQKKEETSSSSSSTGASSGASTTTTTASASKTKSKGSKKNKKK